MRIAGSAATVPTKAGEGEAAGQSLGLDRRALGRTLTYLANAKPLDLLHWQAPGTSEGHARRIGLTGAPGAGKSTLAGHLAVLRAKTRRLGVLAVDPSSPYSGGAILGDRIRMDELQGASQLYIRSVGSRTTSDGLSDNLPEMLQAMDSFGFEEVLLETVGVGQAEHAVRMQVDTLVLVLLPESGDTVQAMKAGIMEMADIYVVNKSDLSGAQKMATDIQRILAMSRSTAGAWRPTVMLTSVHQQESIEALSAQIDCHQAWLAGGDRARALREARARYRLRRLIERLTHEVVAGMDPAHLDAPLAVQLAQALEALGNKISNNKQETACSS